MVVRPCFKISLFLTFLALGSAGISGCAPQEEKSPIIVKVGNEELTLDDLRLFFPDTERGKVSRDDVKEFIGRWINARILYQEGLKSGIDKRPALTKRVEDYRVNLVGNAYVDRVLDQEEKIDDAEILNYFKENQEDFIRTESEYKLKQILVSTKKVADSLYTIVRRGQNFDGLAESYARKTRVRNFRWNLGYVGETQVLDTILRRIKAMRVGAVTRPIKTDFGFHLFQIEDVKAKGTKKDLANVRDEIIARLKNTAQQERFRQHLRILKSAARIETNFQLLDAMPLDSLFSQSE